MSTASQLDVIAEVPELPDFARGIPILYEDEGQEDMGESELHMLASHILSWGLKAQQAEKRIQQLEAELDRLRGTVRERKKNGR